MDGQCEKHQFEPAADLCRHCGDEFCHECLVYAFGRGQAPFCIACALAASGVRSTAGRPTKISRRELRRRRQELARGETQRVAAGRAVDVRALEPTVGTDADLDWALAADAASDPDPYAWAEPQRLTGTSHRVPF